MHNKNAYQIDSSTLQTINTFLEIESHLKKNLIINNTFVTFANEKSTPLRSVSERSAPLDIERK